MNEGLLGQERRETQMEKVVFAGEADLAVGQNRGWGEGGFGI